MSRVRKLSTIEHGHVAHTLARGPSFLPTYNRFVLEGDGEFDVEQWRHAASVAASANAGLRLRLKGILGWMHWDDGGLAPQVQVIENCPWDGHSERGMEFLTRPMDLLHGPLAEIFLLPGKPARAVFRTHHGAMDGIGTRLFVDDVFRVLNGEAPLGARADIGDAELLQANPVTTSVKPDLNCYAVAGPAEDVAVGYLIRRVVLARRVRNVIPKMLEKLAAFARQNNAGDGTARFRVTIDWRRELPEQERPLCTNLTGFLFIDVDANTSERDLVRIMRNKLKEREHLHISKILGIFNWVPLRLINRQVFKSRSSLHLRQRYATSGTVSSLGELEPGQYQCPGFATRHCFALPVPFFLTPVFVTVWGNPDGMDIVVGMPSSFGSGGRIEKLCDFLRHELAE